MWILFEYGDGPYEWNVLCASEDKAALDAECIRLRRVEYEYKCESSRKSKPFSEAHPFDRWRGSFGVQAVHVWPKCGDSLIVKSIDRKMQKDCN